MAEERAFSWDDTYQETESEFTLLPPGDYDFTIVDFERGYFDGSEKMPACPEANLKYKVVAADGKEATIKQKLFLHSKSQWQLTNFACAIGYAKRGDGKFSIRWNELIGATGRFQLGIHKYKDNEYNQVKKFYDKEPAAGGVTYQQGAF